MGRAFYPSQIILDGSLRDDDLRRWGAGVDRNLQSAVISASHYLGLRMDLVRFLQEIYNPPRDG